MGGNGGSGDVGFNGGNGGIGGGANATAATNAADGAGNDVATATATGGVGGGGGAGGAGGIDGKGTVGGNATSNATVTGIPNASVSSSATGGSRRLISHKQSRQWRRRDGRSDGRRQQAGHGLLERHRRRWRPVGSLDTIYNVSYANGGKGGDAAATATGISTGGNSASVSANAVGGAGGDNYSNAYARGAGGGATASAFGASGSGEVQVSAM